MQALAPKSLASAAPWSVDCKSQPDWLAHTLENLNLVGFAVVQNVLASGLMDEIRQAMYRTQRQIHDEVGTERLERAGEIGVLRLMMKFDPLFYRLLELPELLAVIDHTVGNTAVMHLQNGFILPSYPAGQTPSVFQNSFHQDFKRVLNGYLMSVNTFMALDDYTRENGATLVVPGSHQKPESPDAGYMMAHAVPVECPAGSMIVFDSTLWHAAGINTSGQDRLGMNHQFTRSYLKQQFDYVRALSEETILTLPARTQQLLGYYTRVVTSLDEFYQPPEKRLYRGGQG